MHVAQELIPWMDNAPRPVALAVGRIVRSISPTERLDACIKAAEVVTRFMAVAALASCASMRPADLEPLEIKNFNGNLAFGVFEEAAHAAATVSWDHPLRGSLRKCLKSTKRHKAITGQQLRHFVELRNELGHSITPADQARARVLFERDDPIGGLIEILEGLGQILAYPLLVLLIQEHRRGRFISRFSFFSGEGEPIPRELELQQPVYEWEVPYLCTPNGLIPLSPGLIYEPRSSDGRFELCLLDAIGIDGLAYKSVEESRKIKRPNLLRELSCWIKLPGSECEVPQHPLLEIIACSDGRSLYSFLSGKDDSRNTSTEGNLSSAAKEEDSAPLSDTTRFVNARDFEETLGRYGLGAAYRDVFYCLADTESGARAEADEGGVRVVTGYDEVRVLATMELTSAKALRVTLFLGALKSDVAEGVDDYLLRANESADCVVRVIKSAFDN